MTFIHPCDDRWARALRSGCHDVYATPEYVLADAAINTAEPTGFLAVDGDRLFLLPLLVRGVEVTGFDTAGAKDVVSPYGYPGIVLSAAARQTPGFVDQCFARFLEEARRREIVSAFVRLHPLLNADVASLIERIEVTPNGATVSLDLDRSEAEIWSAMRKGHTNAINKATRAGYDVDIGAVGDRFDDLALVYQETLERLGQASKEDYELDRLRRFASLDEARVAVARLHGDVAGAYLFFECNGIVQMHLGGTRSEFMQPSPSHLLIHRVALWAKARGNHIAHLGGGVGGSTTDSLFRFKSGFSPIRHPYETLRLVANCARYERLVDARARDLGEPRDALLAGEYFPAYRAIPADCPTGGSVTAVQE